MSVFRFKILVEEVDDVHREVEVLSNITFKQFHELILKIFDIKPNKHASFFISNSKWQKINEITLGRSSKFENSIDGLKTKLDKVVNDDEPRLIYFNESTPQFTFMLELQIAIDISKEEKKKYPRVVKSVGNLPSNGTGFMDDDIFENVKLHIDDILEEPDDDEYY